MQVITSFHPEGADDHLLVFASTNQPQEEGMPSQLRMQIPRSKAYFTGTGTCLQPLLVKGIGMQLLHKLSCHIGSDPVN